MKKVVFLCIALSLAACKKEEKTENKTSLGDAIEGMSNLGKVANKMDEVTKNIDELKTKTPVSNDVLKAVVPENLGGLKRTEISVGQTSVMNVSSADAKYSDDNKRINLTVMDGAGETGSSLVSIFMMSLSADMEKTTENGFEKTTTINGIKAMVSENKNADNINSEIKMVVKNRYMISIEGSGYTVEELSKTISEINLSELP